MKIVEYGNTLLSYGVFLDTVQFVEIKQVVLSTVARLSRLSARVLRRTAANSGSGRLDIDLEAKLAKCMESQALFGNNKSVDAAADPQLPDNVLKRKLNALLADWRTLPATDTSRITSRSHLSFLLTL